MRKIAFQRKDGKKTMEIIQGSFGKIAEHLHRKLSGEFFEFVLPYVGENCRFEEINRFNDESRQLVRFKNEYEGNTVVEITDWTDKESNKYFEAFVYFLRDRMLKYPHSLLVLTSEKDCPQEFIQMLEELFEEEICLNDLGVKCKETEKRTIGFAFEESCGQDTETYCKEGKKYV